MSRSDNVACGFCGRVMRQKSKADHWRYSCPILMGQGRCEHCHCGGRWHRNYDRMQCDRCHHTMDIPRLVR